MREHNSIAILPPTPVEDRPVVRGKFIHVRGKKLYIRGVTYGPFRPESDGSEYHDPDSVERDFSDMSAQGINAVRTYTVPPRWLLDCAHCHGLWVMVGFPWEQHIAFLQDRRLTANILRQIRKGLRMCAGHPAVLCYAIGNEVPSSIVRWHGHGRVERHIESLYRAAKTVDPHALVAYVNYPSTEYLHLPFVDLMCFNVYLECPDRLSAYLARLQNIAGDRPLLLAEIGLDSRQHGLEAQAKSLQWQTETAFAAGIAGLFVFAWTDEWHRGRYDIEDWDFGLTDRHRQPKPALLAVRSAFSRIPFPWNPQWPRVTVVVCTCNGARWIGNCLDSLARIEYPDFEVIVVNDGSRDPTSELVKPYGVRLIEIPNSGLSHARNVGMRAATGEIVAYVDDDVRVDPHWLQYLVHAFRDGSFAAVGGPNIAPAGDGPVAECVANAPGGPVHVLLADQIAEHIPGCNMAFRKTVLESIGGFDTRFRVAGDDVDICWRLLDDGNKIGFHAGAMVWHHRRNSIRAYWKQQVGYGRAEALLQKKWPEKYNAAGQPSWVGRLYGNGRSHVLNWSRTRIYHGTWGTALFQSVYEPAPSHFWSIARMPEWYLMMIALAALAVLGLFWWPLLMALPVLIIATAPLLIQSALCATRVRFDRNQHRGLAVLGLRFLTTILHLVQPLARLVGRRSRELKPSRRSYRSGLAIPGLRMLNIWSESWHAPQDWLSAIEAALKEAGATLIRGGDFDRWDLELRGGLLGAVRIRMAIEEHGGGRQLVRVRFWPRCQRFWLALSLICAVVAVEAAMDYATLISIIFASGAASYWLVLLDEWSRATALLMKLLRAIKSKCEDTGQRPESGPGTGEKRETWTAKPQSAPPAVIPGFALEMHGSSKVLNTSK